MAPRNISKVTSNTEKDPDPFFFKKTHKKTNFFFQIKGKKIQIQRKGRPKSRTREGNCYKFLCPQPTGRESRETTCGVGLSGRLQSCSLNPTPTQY